ncbi:hypothetical protein ACOMHN_042158 [Nucella lapillus]
MPDRRDKLTQRRNESTAASPGKSPTLSSSLPAATACHSSASPEGGERRPISLVERLATTHSIWLLAQMSRTGAVHLLKDRQTGVFIIRKSSQAKSLALSVQNRLREQNNVDHYLIELCGPGMRLQGSARAFHSLPALLAHYTGHMDELPYNLTLPEAIMKARSSRELSALAMLGQDFWLSLMSHSTGSPPGGVGNMPKSASEPLSIGQHFQTTDYTDVQTASALTSAYPQSVTRVPHEPHTFQDQWGIQMAASHRHALSSRPTFTSPVPEVCGDSHLPFGPHMLRLKCSKDALSYTDSGEEEGEDFLRPHLQLLGTSPRSCALSDIVGPAEFASLDDHLPQCRPNLYTSAPLELLDLPDDTYFRSNLSDKMSDYEDVWRSSCYDSDSVRNGSIIGAGNHDAASAISVRSEFSKYFALSGGQPDSFVKPATATMSSVDSQPHNVTSKTPKATNVKSGRFRASTNLLSPRGKLNRLKSSSDSSLATVPSPIYAEPVDAIVFREKRSKIPRRRRLSAPSVSTEIFSPTLSEHVEYRAHLDVPRYPTVYWTDTKHLEDPAPYTKFDFELQKNGGADSSQFTNSWRSRSHSASGSQEGGKVNKKNPGWQERFNRLKLGTKVLSQDKSPYAGSVASAQLRVHDSTVFGNNPGMPREISASQLLHKFPVPQSNRTVGAAHRESYSSEPSTVQDLISRAMPEVMVRPVQPRQFPDQQGKPLSEYDNFNPYSPPSASSLGTMFCKPWEAGMVNSFICKSQVYLPPAMDLQERVLKWQEANQTFHDRGTDRQYQQCHQSLRQEETSGIVHDTLRKQAQVVMVGLCADESASVHSEVNTDRKKVGQAASPSSTLYQQPGGSPQKSLTRPQSFYHRSQDQTQPKRVQVKLSRSLSQPGQHFHTVSANTQHQHPLQHQHQHYTVHHDRRTDTGARQGFVDNATAGARGQKEALSSRCPDVINCHRDMAMGSMSRDSTLVSTQRRNTGQLAPCHSHPSESPGRNIKEYIHKLSQDHSTIFGGSIDYFIRCTMESQDKNPHHVMRNVRQFMTGIKNYLVKHGEGQLEILIESERAKLGTNEILNIDGLIETTLHVCVLKPLKHHIYRLLVDFHHRNHSLEMMSRNIRYARTKTPQELGIKPGVTPPHPFALDVTIKGYLLDMQRAFSPLVKLEHLLKVTSAICSNVKVHGKQVPLKGPGSLGADDFLPLLIHTLVHCGVGWAELEADYMWGLLHPSVLSGEGGYCLTTLSSAILLLKNFQQAHDSNSPTLQARTCVVQAQLPSSGEVQGFLKIAFPDKLRDTIVWKTLPVRPNMTTKDVCAMIAHKFKFTNPQDYGLVLLCDGGERQLEESQCPLILKRDHVAAGKQFFLAYKRLDVNIAWPCAVHHP